MLKQVPLPDRAFSAAEQSFSLFTPTSGSRFVGRRTMSTERTGDTASTTPYRLTTVR
jgi:hypothetical protein